MNDDTASRFVSSLVKSIQALCNGYIDFSTSIEVVGHIHLNIDRNKRLDYVLTEEVSKSEGSTVFASHSYHSHPPPSLSKTPNDASSRHRKSQQDADPLGISSITPEVPSTRSDSNSRNTNRVGDSGDSSHSGSQESNSTSMKPESRSSCQIRDNTERRRRSGLSTQRSPSPAAKRSRNNDISPSIDVIEIKEEPEDEPAVFFGNAGGGADIQTPDFSNVVMESLDRVSKVEGSSLVAGGDALQMQQQQPFPVMLHSNMPSTSSSVPGGSDPRASTSGAKMGGSCIISIPLESSGSLWVPVDKTVGKPHYNNRHVRSNSRFRQRGEYKKYLEADLFRALDMVLIEGFSVRQASNLTGVPASTLTDKLRTKKTDANDIQNKVMGLKQDAESGPTI